MKKLIFVGISISALIFSLFATYSHSHGTMEELTGVHKSRHIYMEGLGKSMKAFSNFVKRGKGDPLELAAMAAKMAANVDKIPDLFPINTGMSDNEHSEAKDNIWTEWEDFIKASKNLAPLATDVEAAFKSGELDNIGTAVKKLGEEGCRGCHKQFREKKN